MKHLALTLAITLGGGCIEEARPGPAPVSKQYDDAPDCVDYLICITDCADKKFGSVIDDERQHCVDRCPYPNTAASYMFLDRWAQECAGIGRTEGICDDGLEICEDP